MRFPIVVAVAASFVLSACGTTGDAAGGWGSPRVHSRPAPRPAPRPPVAHRPVPPVVEPAPLPTLEETRSGLVIPVVGISPGDLRDTYTSPRSGGRTHHAIDIAAPTGTPLVAVTDGTVTRAAWNRLGGRTLYLRSADGRYDYYYAHLDSYAPGVEAGLDVRRGDVIGTVGATGNARGPHLHFQVLDLSGSGRGTPVNPFGLLSAAEIAAAH